LLDATGDKLREDGVEFGSVTGRPRRTGWLDLPALRYAARVNGLDGLAVTKLDVLTGHPELKVCVAYDTPAGRSDELPIDRLDEPSQVTPIYESFEGWNESLAEVRSRGDLPRAAREYLQFLEQKSGVPLYLVSVGPRRSETMVIRNPFSG
jgi:adenylosuccinate synthase